MKYILAHDLGTSGNKATLFSEEGSLVASVTQHYPVYYSNGNWAEQDPNDLPMWILLISPPYPSAAR